MVTANIVLNYGMQYIRGTLLIPEGYMQSLYPVDPLEMTGDVQCCMAPGLHDCGEPPSYL